MKRPQLWQKCDRMMAHTSFFDSSFRHGILSTGAAAAVFAITYVRSASEMLRATDGESSADRYHRKYQTSPKLPNM